MPFRRPAPGLLPFALILSSIVPAHAAEPKGPREPVTLLSQTYMPEIVGDFDHFTVDLKHNRLFLAAEVHHSIEVFDLKTGDHQRSIPGFKTPHSIVYSPEKDQLLVCDGGASELDIVNGESMQISDRVPLVSGAAPEIGDSPDAAFYDAANRLYYIGNGGASAKMDTSRISVFSVDQGKLIGDFDIPGNNVESIGVDNIHHRLYVNIRDKKEIGVYDLDKRQLITTWTAPDINRNTALLVDPSGERIFVASRTPAFLYVFNRNGNVVAKLPCVERNDDMNWDPATKLLYISGTQGLSVFHQDSPDKYTEVTRIPTNGGKTSELVPEVNLLFVAHPKTDVDIAGLLVYRLNR